MFLVGVAGGVLMSLKKYLEKPDLVKNNTISYAAQKQTRFIDSFGYYSNSSNKMKINVKVNEECFVIPCGSKKKEIRWLKEEAIKRFNKYSVSRTNTPTTFYSNECEVRLIETDGILDDDDYVQDVLNDKDFVVLGKSKLLKLRDIKRFCAKIAMMFSTMT